MNWAQNKFIIGFSAAMIVGCGGLGFLTWKAAAEFDAERTTYEEAVAKYNGLRRSPLYPNSENLKKLEEQKGAVVEAASALREKLAAISFPLEAITPEQFQDKLRATVSSVAEKARAAGTKLPDKFYLGFDKYQSQPPRMEAAAPLLRELKVLELVANTLIENKVDAIAPINRSALPEEDGAKPAARAVPKGHAASGAKGAKDAALSGAELISKFPFEIQFSGEQNRLRRALNDLVKNQKQFLIVRSVEIKNDNDKPTPKGDLNPPAAPAAMDESGAAVEGAAAPGQAAQPQKDESLHYIVGTEKISMRLHLEMVVFESSFPK